MTREQDIKYYVIWDNRRIGFILNDVYHDKIGDPCAIFDQGSLSGLGNKEFTVDENDDLLRSDGTKFRVISESDPELKKTMYANGGSI